MKLKQTVECKSLGLQLPEDVARQVDEIVKTLPKDYKYTRKGAMPETSELVSGERADISMVSVESIDRDGDVILAKGINTEMFSRNPIVTFAHQYHELPVGRCAWMKKVSGGVRAKTVYTDATETARAVWQMTQEGILRGKSIGFLPVKVRSATKEEISRNPHWKNAGSVIESSLLLEYAVAPIPVNQDALVEAVAKGITTKAMLKKLGFSVPEAKPLSDQRIAEIIRREFAKGAAMLTPEAIREKALEMYRA